ncbi:hypothetical protein HPT27_07340 [Permianibacter sp. IMCC34836]|uniref:hypothetical protein n=1 Tax=Permianibacter fluminis TaxID=2738515 RepID=UPI001552B2A0|nr:hypothetical protein [Permianibacter fluminis]NQD36836.1 hypothetical protein [Permianibacter fluminis]
MPVVVLLLLFCSSALAANAPISVSEWRAQLSEPAAQRYQQQLEQIRLAGSYHGELDGLPSDPAVAAAARTWLLHEAMQQLRTQDPTPAALALATRLSQSPDDVLLNQDVEGRLRAVSQAPVAQAAQATLRWWQTQARAAVLRQTLDRDSVMQAAAQWQQLDASERDSWLLALQQPAGDWPARLADIERPTLAKQAPELAAAVALAVHDATLAAALLRREPGEIGSRLLSAVATEFPDQQLALYDAALANPALRSQSWFQLATVADAGAQQRLQQAAASGDRSAIAAWLQQQGEQTLPTLQRWLASKNEAQQLNAIYALRLLATPAARQQLQQAAKQPQLSAKVRRELQP